jgi:hypothetical protein
VRTYKATIFTDDAPQSSTFDIVGQCERSLLGGVVFAHIDAIDVSDGVPLAIRPHHQAPGVFARGAR